MLAPQKKKTQAAFDRAARWLLKQGQPAVSRTGTSFVYVNSKGHRCGIGCLLTAQEIAHLKRGKRLAATLDELGKTFVDALAKRLGVTSGFLRGLQQAHDEAGEASGWERAISLKLRVLASDFALDGKVFNKVKH